MFSFLNHIKSHKFLMVSRVGWFCLWITDKKIRYKLVFQQEDNFLVIMYSTRKPVFFEQRIGSFNSFPLSSLPHSWFLILLAAYVCIWSLSKIFIYLRKIIIFSVIKKSCPFIRFLYVSRYSRFHYHLKSKIDEITGTVETAIPAFSLNCQNFCFMSVL